MSGSITDRIKSYFTNCCASEPSSPPRRAGVQVSVNEDVTAIFQGARSDVTPRRQLILEGTTSPMTSSDVTSPQGSPTGEMNFFMGERDFSLTPVPMSVHLQPMPHTGNPGLSLTLAAEEPVSEIPTIQLDFDPEEELAPEIYVTPYSAFSAAAPADELSILHSERVHSPMHEARPKKGRRRHLSLGLQVDRSHLGSIAASSPRHVNQTQEMLQATMRDDPEKSEKLAEVLDKLGEPIGARLGNGVSGVVYRLGAKKVLKIYKHPRLVGKSAFTTGRDGEAAALGLRLRSLTATRIYAWDPHRREIVIAVQPSDLRPHHQHLAVEMPLIPAHRELDDLAGRLSKDDYIGYASDFIAQLQELHAHGILHGDHKLKNVLLTRTGVLKIADFGLARRLEDASYLPTKQEGTIAYQAPEIKRGRYTKESDLWTLGVMLYKMYTGTLPFSGDFWNTFGANHDQVAFPEGMPDGLKSLIYDLLNQDHTQRPSLEECLQRLQEL